MHSDWQTYELRELIRIRHGFAFASEHFVESGPYVLLTPGNFREEGGFRWLGEKQKFYDGPVPNGFLLNAGDMLIAMTEQAPGLLGSTFFVPGDYTYLHNQRLGAIDLLAPSELTLEYLHYLFASTPIRREISADAGGTKVRHTSPEKLLSLRSNLPALRVQRRIAEILRTWDEAIEKAEGYLALVNDRFSGLRQRLLGHHGTFRSEWRTVPLSELADPVRRKSDGAQHPIMTISGKFGFLRQDEKFNRFMAGDSLENYTCLLRGEFAYNKGNSKTYPQGCIYRLTVKSALVPHVYISFRLHDSINSDFYAHLFEAGFLNRQLARLINAGVRNDGLLNISGRDFFGCKLPVPSQEEQANFAEILRLAKCELAGVREQINNLERQKCGLVQKLLSGEWRVPLRDGDVVQMADRILEEAAE
jgi:type I restriction enzyme S subunit